MPRLLICTITWAVLAFPTAHAQDCPAANNPEQIEARLHTAQDALKSLESEAFSLAMEEISLMLPCLDAQPDPALTAELHRLRGIELYASGKADAANHAFLASKVLAPEYAFPQDMFSEGHALIDLWTNITPTGAAHTRAPVPKKSTVSFDGTLTRDRPSDRATLFQHLTLEGEVQTTQYLMPKDSLPTYASVPRQRNRLIAASIATTLAAGTSYAVAWQARQNFMKDDGSRTRKELERLRRKVNTSFISAGVCAALTTAGFGAAIVIGPR